MNFTNGDIRDLVLADVFGEDHAQALFRFVLRFVAVILPEI